MNRKWLWLGIVSLSVVIFSMQGASAPLAELPPGKDVRVINTVAEAVPVTLPGPIAILDPEAMRQPARILLDNDPFDMTTPEIYTVPEGKRLVVEHVGVFSTNVVTPLWSLLVQDIGSGHGNSLHRFLGEVVPGCSPDCYVLSAPIHFYADAGDRLIRNDAATGNGLLNVTGYLIDLP